MDIIRDSLTSLADRFHYETSVEHFVLPNPSNDDYNKVSPYFKKYGVTPQDAFAVLVFFDKNPANLAKKDLESRIKMLNILLTILDEPGTSELILQNMGNISDDQKENAKKMINLLKRLVKLLILEAEGKTSDTSNNQSSKMMIIILLVIVAVLSYMLYSKK
jgi:hypothetical protein